MITYDLLLCFSMICSSTIAVFASSKGPINYMKVFVSNKKVEKPIQILPIKQVVSANPPIATDQGTPTRMTLRDVYLHESTDYSSDNHMTENYDKRIVGDDKTVTRYPVDDALVQRMCLDIASAVHRQISEQTMCAIVSGTTASGTTTHRKSEQQQKKQQQKQEQQQQKQQQEQQRQKQQLQQKKQQKQKKQQQRKQQQQQQQQQQQKKQHHKQQQKDQQHEHVHKEQQQKQPQQKRRRHLFPKVSPRPVRYNELKESGIVTTGQDDPSVTQVTSVGVVEEDVDDSRQDEDADQSGKVWEVNMVDDHVMFNSAKSQEQRPEAFTAVADDYDDGNQTS